jgi:Nitrile hydratase beta subunit.
MRCSASPRRGSGGRRSVFPRAQYVAGYYQRWLATLEQIVLDRGVLATGELDADSPGSSRRLAARCGRACFTER